MWLTESPSGTTAEVHRVNVDAQRAFDGRDRQRYDLALHALDGAHTEQVEAAAQLPAGQGREREA